MYQLSQLAGCPACVGPGAVATVVVDVGMVEMTTVEVGVAVVEATIEVIDEEEDVPTQYASSAQKPLKQSEDTAGFHARNCAEVISYAASTVEHVSPAIE